MGEIQEDQPWFLYSEEGQTGPYSLDQIRDFLRDGSITPEWYVWRDGLPDWVCVAELPEFGVSIEMESLVVIPKKIKNFAAAVAIEQPRNLKAQFARFAAALLLGALLVLGFRAIGHDEEPPNSKEASLVASQILADSNITELSDSAVEEEAEPSEASEKEIEITEVDMKEEVAVQFAPVVLDAARSPWLEELRSELAGGWVKGTMDMNHFGGATIFSFAGKEVIVGLDYPDERKDSRLHIDLDGDGNLYDDPGYPPSAVRLRHPGKWVVASWTGVNFGDKSIRYQFTLTTNSEASQTEDGTNSGEVTEWLDVRPEFVWSAKFEYGGVEYIAEILDHDFNGKYQTFQSRDLWMIRKKTERPLAFEPDGPRSKLIKEHLDLEGLRFRLLMTDENVRIEISPVPE